MGGGDEGAEVSGEELEKMRLGVREELVGMCRLWELMEGLCMRNAEGGLGVIAGGRWWLEDILENGGGGRKTRTEGSRVDEL